MCNYGSDMFVEGAAAKVYRARWKSKDKDVALKLFNPEYISFDPKEFSKEVALLR